MSAVRAKSSRNRLGDKFFQIDPGGEGLHAQHAGKTGQRGAFGLAGGELHLVARLPQAVEVVEMGKGQLCRSSPPPSGKRPEIQLAIGDVAGAPDAARALAT